MFLLQCEAMRLQPQYFPLHVLAACFSCNVRQCACSHSIFRCMFLLQCEAVRVQTCLFLLHHLLHVFAMFLLQCEAMRLLPQYFLLHVFAAM